MSHVGKCWNFHLCIKSPSSQGQPGTNSVFPKPHVWFFGGIDEDGEKHWRNRSRTYHLHPYFLILSLSFPVIFLFCNQKSPCLLDMHLWCEHRVQLTAFVETNTLIYILESNRLTHNFQRIHSWRWKFHAKLLSRFGLQGDEPAMLAAFPKNQV